MSRNIPIYVTHEPPPPSHAYRYPPNFYSQPLPATPYNFWQRMWSNYVPSLSNNLYTHFETDQYFTVHDGIAISSGTGTYYEHGHPELQAPSNNFTIQTTTIPTSYQSRQDIQLEAQSFTPMCKTMNPGLGGDASYESCGSLPPGSYQGLRSSIESEPSMKSYLSESEEISERKQKPAKTHECGVCRKKFPRPSGLRTHMNSHNNVKPFACGFRDCHRAFTVQSNARRHLKTHGVRLRSARKARHPYFVHFDTPLVSSPPPPGYQSEYGLQLEWLPPKCV